MDSTPECVSEFQPFINALLTETPVIVHVGSMFPDTYNEGTNFGKSMKELDEIEAQYEKKLDDLFTCERSLDEIEHEVGAIKEQEARDEKKKMECEQSLVYMLKERELALRDQFLLMEKVDELEANPIKHQDTQEEIDHVNTQLAHMEQELVASKLELADVKGNRNLIHTHILYNRFNTRLRCFGRATEAVSGVRETVCACETRCGNQPSQLR